MAGVALRGVCETQPKAIRSLSCPCVPRAKVPPEERQKTADEAKVPELAPGSVQKGRDGKLVGLPGLAGGLDLGFGFP